MSGSTSEMSMSEEDASHGEDYVAQYFGFRPQTFTNGMYNAIVGYMLDAMTALIEAIQQHFPGKVSGPDLQEGSAELWQKAVKRLDDRFDMAEVYLLANVFSMPRHFILPEDEVQVTSPCSQEEMEQLDKDLKAVIDRTMAVRLANAKLSDRLKEIKTLQAQANTDLTNINTLYTKASKKSPAFPQSANLLKTTASLLENVEATLDEP